MNRSNTIPVQKKNDKQLVENYQSISLLPIFGKNFEKQSSRKLLTSSNPNHSGFRPSDSCINQLLAITHETFQAFDCNPPLEVKSVFLDFFKLGWTPCKAEQTLKGTESQEKEDQKD